MFFLISEVDDYTSFLDNVMRFRLKNSKAISTFWGAILYMLKKWELLLSCSPPPELSSALPFPAHLSKALERQ